jgi:antitoxin FitA
VISSISLVFGRWPMAQIVVRNLDDEVKDKLRVRAAQHRRSMEAEVRAILTEAIAKPPDDPVGQLLELLRSPRSRVEPNLPPDPPDHTGAIFD